MPPKNKKGGRPIKKFPDVSEEIVTPAGTRSWCFTFLIYIENQAADLNTLAKAAECVDSSRTDAWPKLNLTRNRLEHLRTLQTDQGLSTENRKQLISAINSLHVLLVAPWSNLDEMPESFKNEFREQATMLTGSFLRFALDVAQKTDDTVKDQFLQILLDKLIRPFRIADNPS